MSSIPPPPPPAPTPTQAPTSDVEDDKTPPSSPKQVHPELFHTPRPQKGRPSFGMSAVSPSQKDGSGQAAASPISKSAAANTTYQMGRSSSLHSSRQHHRNPSEGARRTAAGRGASTPHSPPPGVLPSTVGGHSSRHGSSGGAMTTRPVAPLSTDQRVAFEEAVATSSLASTSSGLQALLRDHPELVSSELAKAAGSNWSQLNTSTRGTGTSSTGGTGPSTPSDSEDGRQLGAGMGSREGSGTATPDASGQIGGGGMGASIHSEAPPPQSLGAAGESDQCAERIRGYTSSTVRVINLELATIIRHHRGPLLRSSGPFHFTEMISVFWLAGPGRKRVRRSTEDPGQRTI